MTACIPFLALLACIAVLPVWAPAWWHSNTHKAFVACLLGVPCIAYTALTHPHTLPHTTHEYLSFIVLLGTLFVVSGGCVLRGTLSGTPGTNTVFLLVGSVVASLIGTTGASMVLIRPLLRANNVRKNTAHIIVFFIFLVSNAGGLLTPLGDPPLFLGFLRGVPFTWTFRLFPIWCAVVGFLSLLFYIVDSTLFRKEDLETPGDLDKEAVQHSTPLSVAGWHNILLLCAAVTITFMSGHQQWPFGVAETLLCIISALSYATTPKTWHNENAYTWHPIVEVAVLFAGIFATMMPALQWLGSHAHQMPLHTPNHYFWFTGILSSFLDNAPTYVAMGTTAASSLHIPPHDFAALSIHPEGMVLLKAISAGAVLMGANTYIGNGPNMMVRSIAEQHGAHTPHFGAYMIYSGCILLPVFVFVGLFLL